MADADDDGTKAEAAPASHEIHRVIREEGEGELGRHKGALAWSGLAAGLSMGFSFLTLAILQATLPDVPWRPLISSFGYTLGFLIVVLGKQQLFTESTLTAVLPVLAARGWHQVPNLLAFWLIVLLSNLVGTWLFAYLISGRDLFDPPVAAALEQVATGAMHDPFWPMLLKAVLAGWLIALMVWLLPGAGPARALIIVILTYVVAVSHFPHVIAGSVECAFAVLTGAAGVGDYLWRFMAPTLTGNVLGGVALVALLNHAPLATEATD